MLSDETMGKKGDQKGRNRELVRYRAVVSCRCGPKGLIIIYRRGGGGKSEDRDFGYVPIELTGPPH